MVIGMAPAASLRAIGLRLTSAAAHAACNRALALPMRLPRSPWNFGDGGPGCDRYTVTAIAASWVVVGSGL